MSKHNREKRVAFEMPMAQITRFGREDVITTSQTLTDAGSGVGDEFGWDDGIQYIQEIPYVVEQ